MSQSQTAKATSEKSAFQQEFHEALAAVELIQRRRRRSPLFRRKSLRFRSPVERKPRKRSKWDPALYLKVRVPTHEVPAFGVVLCVLFKGNPGPVLELVECSVKPISASRSKVASLSFDLRSALGSWAEAPRVLSGYVLCVAQCTLSPQNWVAVEPNSALEWTREKVEQMHAHLLFNGTPAQDRVKSGSTRVVDLSGWEGNTAVGMVSLVLTPPKRGLNLGLSLPTAKDGRTESPIVHYHFAFPVPNGPASSDSEARPQLSDVESEVQRRLQRNGTDDWKTWVEVRQDLSCAFCAAYVAKSGRELLTHLCSSHPQLRYEAFLDEGHRMHCVVRTLRRSRDARIARKRKREEKFFRLFIHKCQRKESYALHRVPLRDANTLAAYSASRRGQGKQSPAEMSSNCASFAPVRQYYHSRTYLPLLPSEMDIDSDEELDDDWMHQESERLINEFEDVAPEEKLLMKLWNRHTRSHKVQADNRVPYILRLFSKRFAPTILRENLWEVFLLHSFNLWDNSLVTRDEILECAAIVRNYRDSHADKEGRKDAIA